jgi:Na+/melibiose symporter-like transporter
MVNPRGASAESLSTDRVVRYGVGSLVTGIYSALPSALLLYFMTDTLAIAPGIGHLGA